MGRQFRFYLLPSDVDHLVDDLKNIVGIRLFLAKTPTAELVEVSTRTSERSKLESGGLLHCERCYLAPDNGTRIHPKFIEQQGYWLVNTESEVIEFDGCDYGGDILTEGRFYYQIDVLSASGDALIPKSLGFVKWAERLFRRAKRSLIWSTEFNAYIGREARLWKSDPGHKFIDKASEMRLFSARNYASNKIQ
jgi:hypothetical protein